MAGVIGTGVNSPPVQLANTMDAITQKHLVAKVADQIMKPSPELYYLDANRQMFSGPSYILPLLTAEIKAGGAFYGAQMATVDLEDVIQPAEQQARPYRQFIVVPLTDIWLNSGSSPVDLLGTYMEVGAASMTQKLGRACYHTSPQNTTNDIDDLDSWYTQTGNTIAGVNRTTYPVWNPQANVPAGGAITALTLSKAIQSAAFGPDQPNVAFCAQAAYASMRNSILGGLIRVDPQEADTIAIQGGFRRNFVFDGVTIIPSLYTTAGEMIVFNSKYARFKYSEAVYYRVGPWVKPSYQDVMIAELYTALNLAVDSPRTGVTITGAS